MCLNIRRRKKGNCQDPNHVVKQLIDINSFSLTGRAGGEVVELPHYCRYSGYLLPQYLQFLFYPSAVRQLNF